MSLDWHGGPASTRPLPPLLLEAPVTVPLVNPVALPVEPVAVVLALVAPLVVWPPVAALVPVVEQQHVSGSVSASSPRQLAKRIGKPPVTKPGRLCASNRVLPRALLS